MLRFSVTYETDENGNRFAVYEAVNTTTVRDKKGNSLVMLPDDYVVVDIETTGLDSAIDEIIELGALRVEKSTVVSQFQSFVKPNERIDSFITELTGITNEMVSNAPSIEEILPDFLNFVGNSVIVGHNVNFDVNFIYDECVRLFDTAFPNNFVDTLRLSRKLFRDALLNHKLSTIAEHFNLGTPVHRAIGDCLVIHDFFEVMRKHVSANDIDLAYLFSRSYSVIKAKDIVPTNNEFDETHPFFGKYCVFTGKLQHMTRAEAQQLVVNLGGFCTDGLTAKTNFLVLGNFDYCGLIKNGKSNKVKKAESLILKGNDLEIISENTFYELVAQN